MKNILKKLKWKLFSDTIKVFNPSDNEDVLGTITRLAGSYHYFASLKYNRLNIPHITKAELLENGKVCYFQMPELLREVREILPYEDKSYNKDSIVKNLSEDIIFAYYFDRLLEVEDKPERFKTLVEILPGILCFTDKQKDALYKVLGAFLIEKSKRASERRQEVLNETDSYF